MEGQYSKNACHSTLAFLFDFAIFFGKLAQPRAQCLEDLLSCRCWRYSLDPPWIIEQLLMTNRFIAGQKYYSQYSIVRNILHSKKLSSSCDLDYTQSTNSWSFHSKPESFDGANSGADFGTSKDHLSPSVQCTFFGCFCFSIVQSWTN